MHQRGTQFPLLHSLPSPQSWPHEPQLLSLPFKFTQPVDGPQSVSPLGHWQLPELHALLHCLPQLPQFPGSDWVLVHAPLQSLCPAGQTQLPPAQPAPAAHVAPQSPQFPGSFWVLVHTPLQALCPLGHTHIPSVQSRFGEHVVLQAPQ
jgi:hypothetical protein